MKLFNRDDVKNQKSLVLHFRIDKKLYEQLKRYADRNDESNISLSARRAIELFIKERG